MSTELAVFEEPALPALPSRVGVPGTQDFDSWTEVAAKVIRLAEVICDTPFVPDGMRGSAPAVAAAILAGREMGLAPMTSLANLDVIKGKPSMKPVLMRALVQSQGHKWVEVEVSDVRVILRGCRKGQTDWTEVTFTQAHAKIAGINLGGYPADKLYARASSRLARRAFADVIMGMPYSEDEIEDGFSAEAEIIAPDAPPAIEAPRARTVQRKARQAAPADNPSAAPSASGSEGATRDRQPPAPAQTAPSDDRPAFPEDETPDPSSAATAATPDASTARTGTDDDRHRKLAGIVHQHFKRLGFTEAQRGDRLLTCERISGCGPLDSMSEMSADQLSVVADTLARCKSRGALSVLLSAGEKPDAGEPEGEPADD